MVTSAPRPLMSPILMPTTGLFFLWFIKIYRLLLVIDLDLLFSKLTDRSF
jgi:hypothetical protein